MLLSLLICSAVCIRIYLQPYILCMESALTWSICSGKHLSNAKVDNIGCWTYVRRVLAVLCVFQWVTGAFNALARTRLKHY